MDGLLLRGVDKRMPQMTVSRRVWWSDLLSFVFSSFHEPDLHSAMVLIAWGLWFIFPVGEFAHPTTAVGVLRSVADLRAWAIVCLVLGLGTLFTSGSRLHALRAPFSIGSVWFWLFVIGLFCWSGVLTVMIPTAALFFVGESCRYLMMYRDS